MISSGCHKAREAISKRLPGVLVVDMLLEGWLPGRNEESLTTSLANDRLGCLVRLGLALGRASRGLGIPISLLLCFGSVSHD